MAAFTETFTGSGALPNTYPTSDSGHSWTTVLGQNFPLSGDGELRAAQNSSEIAYITDGLYSAGTPLDFVIKTPAYATYSTWLVEVGVWDGSNTRTSALFSYANWAGYQCRLYSCTSSSSSSFVTTLFSGQSTSQTLTVSIDGTGGITVNGTTYSFISLTGGYKVFFRCYGAGGSYLVRPTIDGISTTFVGQGEVTGINAAPTFGTPRMFPLHDWLQDTFTVSGSTALTSHTPDYQGGTLPAATWAESSGGAYTIASSSNLPLAASSSDYALLNNAWGYRLGSAGGALVFEVTKTNEYSWVAEVGVFNSPSGTKRHSVWIDSAGSTATIRVYDSSTTYTEVAPSISFALGTSMVVELTGTTLWIATTSGNHTYTLSTAWPNEAGLIPFFRAYKTHSSATSYVNRFWMQIEEIVPPRATALDPVATFGTAKMTSTLAYGSVGTQIPIPSIPLLATGFEDTQDFGSPDSYLHFTATGASSTALGMGILFPIPAFGAFFPQTFGEDTLWPPLITQRLRAYGIGGQTHIPTAYYAFSQSAAQTGRLHTRFGQPIALQDYILTGYIADSIMRPVRFGEPFYTVVFSATHKICYGGGAIKSTRFGTAAYPHLVTAAAYGFQPTLFGTPLSKPSVLHAYGMRLTYFGRPALLHRVTQARGFLAVHFGRPALFDRVVMASSFRTVRFGQPSLLHRVVQAWSWRAGSFGRPALMQRVCLAYGWIRTRFGLHSTQVEEGVSAGFLRTRLGTPFAILGGCRTYGWRRTALGRPRGAEVFPQPATGFDPTFFGAAAAKFTYRAFHMPPVTQHGMHLLTRTPLC